MARAAPSSKSRKKVVAKGAAREAPVSKRSAQAERKRQRLLDAAIEVLLSDGIAHFTSTRIAEVAGMHKPAFYSVHMKSVITRVDGNKETIFDKPFDFNSQIHYPLDPMIVLQPGDRITSTCTFENDTNSPVGYGPSSDQEMCYQFAFTYPAGAIDNHVFSLTGDKNTCWGD